MIIEHDHRKATFCREADNLEEEIESIEQSIVSLARELKARVRGWLFVLLGKRGTIITLSGLILLMIAGSVFSEERLIRRKIFRLEKQNSRLKNRNRELRRILSKRRDRNR